METKGGALIVHEYRLMNIADVRPYDSNPRTHSEAQIAQLRRSIQEFGFTNPLLIDEDCNLIAGHGRLIAAQAEGMNEVPAIIVNGLTEAQRRALVIADNKLALNAGWDNVLLAAELTSLKEMGHDLSMIGFTPGELERLLKRNDVGLSDPDDVPEAVPTRAALGDVWQLGAHRLMCGDATSATDVAKLLGDAKPHLMVTDPPYGVNYDANWRNESDRANGKPIGGRAIGKVVNDDRADWREVWALFPGDVAYVWHGALHAGKVAESLDAASLEIRSQIIWSKQQLVIGRGDYHWQHEPCWYAVRKGATGHWQGDRTQTTLWQIDKPHKSETGHSTQKPIECMQRPIANNSERGDAVYDPFMGSGTTIIAATALERVCYGMEVNPAYVDVAVKRWENYTGQTAAQHPP